MDSRKCLYGKASLNISTEYMNASMNSITGSHSAHHLYCSNVYWWGFSKRIVELSYDSLCNVSTEKKVKKKIISPLQTPFVQCKLRAFKKSMMKFFTFKEDDEEEEWDDAKQVQVIKVNIVKVSVLVLVVSLV